MKRSEADMKFLEEMTVAEKQAVIRANGGDTEHLLQILLELQNLSKQSCIDEETANLVADMVGMTPSHVHDVITFYAMLNKTPCGQFVIEVCNSTPCYFSGQEPVVAALEGALKIKMGETTPDGLFSLRYTPCVGRCDIGPVIKIKDDVYGNLDEARIGEILAEYRARSAQ
jgi:NADH-quinone oxidoreductase subunit E